MATKRTDKGPDTTFEVVGAAQLHHPDGRVYTQQDRFLGKDWPAENIKMFVREGYIEDLGKGVAPTRANGTPYSGATDEDTERKKKVGNTGGKPKWGVDPATLDGLDLVALQSRVAQIDPKVPLPDTVEEAIAMLSDEFRG